MCDRNRRAHSSRREKYARDFNIYVQKYASRLRDVLTDAHSLDHFAAALFFHALGGL